MKNVISKSTIIEIGAENSATIPDGFMADVSNENVETFTNELGKHLALYMQDRIKAELPYGGAFKVSFRRDWKDGIRFWITK